MKQLQALIPKGTQFYADCPDTAFGVAQGMTLAPRNLKVYVREADEAYLHTSDVSKVDAIKKHFGAHKVTVTGGRMMCVVVKASMVYWGTLNSGFKYARREDVTFAK